jgi:hypothetical protein
MTDFQIRVINYTSTDEDGNKIYTGYRLQTKRADGPWYDIPVTEEYEERQGPRLMIVDPPKKTM